MAANVPPAAPAPEFSVERAASGAGPAVFVLWVPPVWSPHEAARARRCWDYAWELAGVDAPPLLILPTDCSLATLGDAQLEQMGLMRIPTDGAPA